MKTNAMPAIIMTIALACSAGAALTVSSDPYQSAKRQIAAELDASRRACLSLPGKSIGLCRAEADREYQMATAALEALYNPSREGSYKASIAIANAEYLVARRKCDAKADAAKRSCLNQARAAQIAAKAGADASEDTSIATRVADDKANAGRRVMREEEERTEARGDTALERRNTELHISRERCERLPSFDREACRKESEKRFGSL